MVKLLNIILWHFKALKWFGLTNYTLLYKAKHLRFIKQEHAYIKNSVILCFGLYLAYEYTKCKINMNVVTLTVFNLARLFSSLYFIILIISIKINENKIVFTLNQLLELENIIDNVILNDNKMSKHVWIVKTYNIMQVISSGTLVMIIISLIFNTELIICAVIFIIVWIISYTAESLLFMLVIILINILQKFGDDLKNNENNKVSINIVVNILNFYLNIKYEIESIYKNFLFSKLICTTFRFAAVIYISQNISMNKPNVPMTFAYISYGYNLLSDLAHIILMIFPFATFYKTVRTLFVSEYLITCLNLDFCIF